MAMLMYDEQVNAGYIYLRDIGKDRVASSKEMLLSVVVDYDDKGNEIGIEILNFANLREDPDNG